MNHAKFMKVTYHVIIEEGIFLNLFINDNFKSLCPSPQKKFAQAFGVGANHETLNRKREGEVVELHVVGRGGCHIWPRIV